MGFPYWDSMFINGVRQPAIKVPVVFKYEGIADGNAISVKYKGKWIAAEYDSEPREIVIEGSKLPESGEIFQIQIIDEAKHKFSFDVTVPTM